MKKIVIISILGIISLMYSFSKQNLKSEERLDRKPTTPYLEPDATGIKVALLLDTSNSMDGLIAQAKAQLWQIVNELSLAKYGGKNPHLQIALYEYGNDGLEKSDGYIRKVLDFGNDLDLISEKLFALHTNGGSEYCGAVIQKSLDELRWGKNQQDLNLIFIAGNEPFTQGSVSYEEATTNAKEKNVIVNSIFCGNYQEGINSGWKKGASLTGGDYSAIDHNVVQVYVFTPYDDQIIILNRELNDTYIYYGSQGSKKMELQSIQDSNAAQMNESVAVSRTVSKSKSVYNNASWDLVDASQEKGFEYSRVDKSHLPNALKGKSIEEIKKYVELKAGMRANIRKQIEELNTKRSQFLAENQSKNTEISLENAMLSSIRKQAEGKKYSFE